MSNNNADNTCTGNEYVSSCGIHLIAFYLSFWTLGSLVGLVILWPSCESVNSISSSISDLTVTSISPGSGGIEGGALISVRGTGFNDEVTVSFGNEPAKEVRIVDSTHLRVLSPKHSKGIVDILVSSQGKKSRVLHPGFLYLDPKDQIPKPSINSISPISGPLIGGQQVTIKGAGLQNITSVSFGGLPGKNIQIANDSTVNVTTPSHGEGKVDVSVEAGDTTTLAESYNYSCGVNPNSLFIMIALAGAIGGSLHGLRSLVWHVGNGDLLNKWRLKYFLLPISGIAIAVIFFLAASAGLYTVQGTGIFILIGLSSLVGMFSDQAAEKLKKIAEGLLTDVPVSTRPSAVSVTSLEPTSGSKNGNEEVTIVGKDFDDVVEVRFGGHAATNVKKLTQTSIKVITPQNIAAGKVDVLVINKNGQSFVVRNGYEYI